MSQPEITLDYLLNLLVAANLGHGNCPNMCTNCDAKKLLKQIGLNQGRLNPFKAGLMYPDESRSV